MNPKRSFPKKGTLAHALATDDWSDLTSAEIAEVMGVSVNEILNAVAYLKAQYGIKVEYKRRGKIQIVAGDVQPGTIQWRLCELRGETPTMTKAEIAERLDLTESQVSSALFGLRSKGIDIEYIRKRPWETRKGRESCTS